MALCPTVTCTQFTVELPSFLQDVTTIYTSLAAVLHITNIEFIDASTIDETQDGSLIGDDYHLKIGEFIALLVDVVVLNLINYSQSILLSEEQ